MLRPIWIDDGSPIPDPFGYGERAVEWLRRRKHPKNPAPGSPFVLDPWQERIIRKIYGPCDAHGRRLVREVFLGLPRGNRKTSLSAAITLLHLCGPEMIPASHLVSAASTRKQARECFEEAAMIVEADRKWRGKLNVIDHKNMIRFIGSRARYEAISADAGGAHGSTLALAIVDELHAHKNPHLWQAVRTGTGKVPGSLRVIATTAGAGSENVCFERWSYAKRVQLGEIDDPHFLPVIFAAEEGDDWRDEALWHAVNPGLTHGYPDISALRDHAREGEHLLSERHAFQQFHLNLWQEHSDAPFVTMDIYDKGADAVDLEALRERPCWLAVDLSSNLDLTAVVACWRDPEHEDGYIVHPWFFMPADRVDGRKVKGDEHTDAYRRWVDAGLITTTPGNVVDYRAVQAAIFDICDRFDVRQIGIDPWHAQSTMQVLQDKGLPVVEFRQGAASMVPAISELERAIVGERFTHGGHPVLRWNFQNIRTVRNKNDNIEFHKTKSVDKIDGAVAAAMAVKLAFDSDNPGRAIDDPDFDFSKFMNL
ncbi:UNVERIFIED_ORG: phage terminase large subunit-like protein [Xanthobacter viscosus]|uniref:Terminase large subunit n=1 Tax=Xanthobacter autotrophicus TaxID=280 RepID=A0A6C1KV54_XANAU|nr:terminase TerL endonuclease subunit [Xanthobacter autotrophicus]TLX44796.1 terminase large subunit [Xanthobacter autotrophicus]